MEARRAPPEPDVRLVPDAAGRLRPARLLASPRRLPSDRKGPHRSRAVRRSSGLGDSFPLLLFGATCLSLALYSLLFHAVNLGGRVPLWTYLAGLGGIALAGGLISAAIPEEMEGLPRAGERLGGDLIVVPFREWQELRSRVTQPTGGSSSDAGGEGRSSPTLASAGRARPPTSPAAQRPAPARPKTANAPPPAWWEEALRAAEKDGLLATPGSGGGVSDGPADFHEVLDALDSLAAEAAAPSGSSDRQRPRSSLTPQSSVESPKPPAPSPSRTLAAEPGSAPAEALDRLTEELETLSKSPAAPQVRESRCASCGASVGVGSGTCSACGRPLCRACHDRSVGEGDGSICSVCAMLLNGSEP